MPGRKGGADLTNWKSYGGKPGNKYGARSTVVDGIRFDSAKEARRFQQLRLLEKAGAIRDLQRQVEFELIPAQYEPPRTLKNGRKVRGRCIERKTVYKADFSYIQSDTGEYIVEDAKGFRTEVFKIKKKLMLKKYNIRVREV